jgi:hypothetical protein
MNPNHGKFLEVVTHPHDGCQHEPRECRGALVTDRHFRTTQAVVIVGSILTRGKSRHGIAYRLCADCARLPIWNRGHKHTPITKALAK